MNKEQLTSLILKKKSFLCVGLDADIQKIPGHLLEFEDPIFEFNKQIIDATRDFCVAYKPNFAFYEALGAIGWKSLEKTVNYIGDSHFTIADAKRGDIGNTSNLYAKAVFEQLGFNSITVAPYMGKDSVEPFLQFKDKWVIVLGLTSNPGSTDFQKLMTDDGSFLYEKVISNAQRWGTSDQLMFVIGATQTDYIKRIRRLAPDNFFLVPGVGAQGGDLRGVADAGINKDIGLIVNSSRGIIYASNGKDFAERASDAANDLQLQMQGILEENNLV